MSEWNSMDTLPGDQEEVIVCVETEDPAVFTAMLIDGDWSRSSSGNYSPLDDFLGDWNLVPTKWMYLPKP